MSLGHNRVEIPPREDQVREELERVLASHEFRSSRRSQEFLRYVIEHTLRGQTDVLKERTIGIEVFGRPTSYDPSEDATVRVKAGEVRKRLGIYYAGEGAHNPLRIELPSGTYVPEFHRGAHLEAVVVPLPVSPVSPGRKLTTGRAIAAGAVLAAIAAVAWCGPWKPASALDRFWSPVLSGASPVFVCAAYVPVWNLDRDPSATQPARAEEFVPLTDQFVGGGDLVATSRLTAMLTRMRQPYRLRVGNDVSFADLRSGPAILVGYSYTRWKEISKQMRYFIEVSPGFAGISDNGARTGWAIANLPRDRRTDEDYAIVTRVFHPDTHAMLVEVAGITQYGTDAASDLVTNADLMKEEFQKAPAGWQEKNLQLVLKVKVIAGAPSSPKVVARHFW
ncbi:MAG: hypothetical protein JWP63_781 [Candidatus Solibacter sp.]|nr:hypothetical protein [Candidatus Solibacter sp.]